MANSVVINYLVKVAGVKDVETLKAKLTGLTTSKGFQSAVTGVGIGAGIAAWGALASAVQQVPGFLMDAAKAAAADESSQNRLYTSIKANSAAWDGNRESIEKVISERMKLAFSDEEQRDSLALLVAYTKDVSEALDIQRGAMDLARLKGIDLAQSSKAIVMGMEGSGRALKELGINVKDLTDKHQVLTAVQKAAAGQAIAYAESSEGAFASLQIVTDELSESIGYLILGPLTDLSKSLRDDVIPNIDAAGEALNVLFHLADPVGAAMADAKREFDNAAEAGMKVNSSSRIAATGMGVATESANDLAKSLITAKDAWDLLNNRIDKNNEFVNLPDQITLATAAVETARAELEAIDDTSSIAAAAARIRLRDAEAELNRLRRRLAALRVEYSRPIHVGGTYGPGQNSAGPEFEALGGPVQAGRPYIVGEIGPELFVPATAGTIVPNNRLTLGGGGVQFVYAPGFSTANAVEAQQFAAAVVPALTREMRRQGVL